MVVLYLLDLVELKHESADVVPEVYFPWLPASSRDKLKAITLSSARLQSAAGEILARFAISTITGTVNRNIGFRVGSKGKPYVTGAGRVYYNLSHSGRYIACAVSKEKIGVDVERVRKVNYRVAERYFTFEENQALNLLDEPDKLHYFFRLWTLKESYLKAIGTGLTRSLGSFSVLQTESGYQLIGNHTESFILKSFSIPDDYYLAVCSFTEAIPDSLQRKNMGELLNSLDKFDK